MSAPICGWAFNTGRARKLSPSERLVLWALAEHVNGRRADLTCWPSLDLLEADTGLARTTVVAVLKSLAAHALIAVAKRGRGHQYTLLAVGNVHRSPVANTNRSSVGNVHRSEAPSGSNGAPVSGSPPVGKPHATGSKCQPRAVANVHSNLLKEPLKEPVAREEARSGAASGPEPGREDSSGGSGAPPAPPVPGPAKAPTIGKSDSTNGSGGYIQPNPPRSSNAFLDDPSPHDALPCEIDHDVLRSDLPDPDAPVDPEYVRAVVAELRHELRMRAYPPRAATMSPDDQADAVTEKSRPKTYHPNPEQLAALRKQAGIRAPA